MQNIQFYLDKTTQPCQVKTYATNLVLLHNINFCRMNHTSLHKQTLLTTPEQAIHIIWYSAVWWLLHSDRKWWWKDDLKACNSSNPKHVILKISLMARGMYGWQMTTHCQWRHTVLSLQTSGSLSVYFRNKITEQPKTCTSLARRWPLSL